MIRAFAVALSGACWDSSLSRHFITADRIFPIVSVRLAQFGFYLRGFRFKRCSRVIDNLTLTDSQQRGRRPVVSPTTQVSEMAARRRCKFAVLSPADHYLRTHVPATWWEAVMASWLVSSPAHVARSAKAWGSTRKRSLLVPLVWRKRCSGLLSSLELIGKRRNGCWGGVGLAIRMKTTRTMHAINLRILIGGRRVIPRIRIPSSWALIAVRGNVRSTLGTRLD